MPLSERERIERQVLRHLLFHERSPVRLEADGESCRRFESPDAETLRSVLLGMADKNLFRVLAASPPVESPAAASPSRDRETAEQLVHRIGSDAFMAGVSCMITGEGKRRYAQLRRQTSKFRQDEWLKERKHADPGGWMRSDLDQ